MAGERRILHEVASVNSRTASKARSATRHIISINDLSNREIENVFEVAQSYLDELPDAKFPYKIGRSTNVASKFILASLFYEPSTRTRLSFESAMLRLGGQTITSADPATSSAAKGESLADSVRVISNYADIIVMRHPRDGAARLAAEYSPIPVINGGDGSHEHPTQTLCDLFTLRKKNRSLKNLKVAIAGDLKGSRTIHSFVYALARFGANIVPMAAKGMELPAHVDRRLREEFRCDLVPGEEGSIDALYRTPDEPHQPALFSGPEFELKLKLRKDKIDALYVTRFQKERWTEKDQTYPKIDAKFLRGDKYAHASVLHPLPRVGELDVGLDSDTRAVYFEQAAYGVPIRMALIALLLGLHKSKSLSKYEGGFETPSMRVYDQPLALGMRCANPNCISHEPMEAPYIRNRFYVLKSNGQRPQLRCIYCENDTDRFVVAHRKHKWYVDDASALLAAPEDHFKDFVVFADADEAIRCGYHSKKTSVASRPAQRVSAKSG
jgi:aspartate carbamoyltransferase catalytic subunit